MLFLKVPLCDMISESICFCGPFPIGRYTVALGKWSGVTDCMLVEMESMKR